MGKITPTFADKPRVEAQHEPLSETTAFTMPPMQVSTSVMPTNVVPIVQPLKVALVGTAPSSRLLAPYNDPTWQIWACSPGNMNQIPRFDVWVEIHGNLMFPEHQSYGKPYIDWLKQIKQPVLILKNHYDLPTGVVLPWWDYIKEDAFGQDFFTSSFAWMMAHAMTIGAKEIQLFGIDMASRDEYILQRPGFYHFRREAHKRGVKISAPHESDIMQSPPLYGIADTEPFGRKVLAREAEVRGRIGAMESDLQKQQAALAQNVTYLKGALEDLDYFKTIWLGLGNQLAILEAENTRLKLENETLRATAS